MFETGDNTAVNISGILIGAVAFLLIGAFHPVVIKCEYHFGARIWPLFLAASILCCVASLLIDNDFLSTVMAVLGFTCLWSIHELKEQENRVRKGWFPANPRKIKEEENKKRM